MKVTKQELIYIMKVLAERPYKEVAALLMKLSKELEELENEEPK